ncbi:MAG: transposase [Planctomycetota bacterium]
MNLWSEKTEVPNTHFANWLGVRRGKFCDWKKRYGKVNEHNAWVPRDHWLDEWEKQAIIDFYAEHPLDGYRVAVSPSSVYRVLSRAGLLSRWNGKSSKKGTGFVQPAKPHQHWHVDIAYINCWGTFYYLFVVVDGYSRYIVHWDLRASMTERDAEIIIQVAREKFPGVEPRIISDNGPRFTARDFKEFVKLCGMTHVRTSPYYPQSNGKAEATIKTIKVEGVRPASPRDQGEARRAVAGVVTRYNEERLHSGIGYVTPRTKLEGRQREVFAERDRKLVVLWSEQYQGVARRRRSRHDSNSLAGQVGCSFSTEAGQMPTCPASSCPRT